MIIEIHQQYHELCNKRFEQEIEDGRVQLYKGDCLSVLKEILPDVSEPITVWLGKPEGDIPQMCGVCTDYPVVWKQL